MTRKYFGTDGIRGRANAGAITPDMVLKVAMAAAIVLQARRASAEQTNRVIIGKDPRLSGYMIEEAMCAGFVAMGMDVVLTGPIPTPGISYLTRSLRCDLGVMISASHNSFQDNGIKLFGPDGYKLDDALEMEIEEKIDSDLNAQLAAPEKLGKATRLDDCLGRYAEYIKGSFPKRETFEGLKVVIDCANGAAYKVAPQTLWELECEVVAIGNAPNGRNINQKCGATSPENLQKTVLEAKADIGLALDGDADRLIVVDEKGEVVDGDQIMGALALSMKAQGTLQGDTLVSTVMSNLGLERKLAEEGLNLVRTQVGDRYVMEAMRAGEFNLGGEQSGHLILSDYSRTGDGLLAALQVLKLLKDSGKKASEALRVFEPVPQLLRNVRFENGSPLEETTVKDAIKQATETLANDGRILVRASGTEPVIRVMAEGDDAAKIESVVGEICSVIEKAAGQFI